MIYQKHIKRLIDVVLAGTLFLIFSPVFIVLYLLLFIHFEQNPIFKQPRPGYQGKIFYILKFKTMTDLRDSNGILLSDSLRVTKLGSWVRRYSLDELPQLINVIRGDMSLVGPRPLLVEYLALYNSQQAKRHEVRPGVTGWAQINGRNSISWEEKFALDLYYVENNNVLLDLRILFITFFNVIQGKGVSQQGHVSMGKFEGSSI